MTINGKPYVPALTAQAIAERKSWQYRAITYAHGNKSELGALIIAIMGRTVNPPCFHPGGAKITAEGIVIGLFRKELGQDWQPRKIYENVQAFTDIFRGLADALDLNDGERLAMFEEVRKFIRTDERVVSQLF